MTIIGRKAEQAAEAERRRRQQHPEEFPLPDQDYGFWRGDYSLIDPSPNLVDRALREAVRRYVGSKPKQQRAIRNSISTDGCYTLMAFARRSAVFAMRERNAEFIRDGLAALAMIGQGRVDWRDLPGSELHLLYHAAKRIGADADGMFRQVGSATETRVGGLMLEFLERDPERRSLPSGLYVEVQTGKGVGFIERGIADYDPTLDLESLVIAVARLVSADRYQPNRVAVGTDLSPIWVSRERNAELERILAAVRGGATIHARLRPNQRPEHLGQSLIVFIVETARADDAQTLLRLSSSEDAQTHCSIATAAGRLFALIVAAATWEGAEAYETSETLVRFDEALTQLLARFANEAD